MFLLLGLAGFVMLLAIIWLFRNMKRKSTTLDQRIANWHQNFRMQELEIAKEQQQISNHEQLHFLEVAIEDLLRLEGKDAPCTKTDEGICIQLDSKSIYCSYHAHTEEIKSLHKTFHGQSHWILKDGEAVFDFKNIEELMRALTHALRGEPVLESIRISDRFRHS